MKHIKFLLGLCTILFCFNVEHASAQSLNQFDDNDQRHGTWKKHYNNGRVRYVGQFDHGVEVGTFKYFSASNSDFPIIIKKFEGKSGLAEVEFYSAEGVLESKGKMQGKLREGKWLFYHTDGKSVMSEENYLNGVLDGEYKTFYKNGAPTEVAHYKNGKLHGNYKKYAIKGFIYQDFNYENGKLNGMAVYYSRKTGDLIKKGPFKNDLRVGTWENYVDGELVSTEQPALKRKRQDD